MNILTLVGLADDVDDVRGLQVELVRLLGDVLLQTLHLRAIWQKNTAVSHNGCEDACVRACVRASSPQSS